MRVLFKLLKFVLMAMAALVALVVFVRVVDTPGVIRYNRYCGYSNKDALLAAETNDVVRFDAFTVRGTNVTIVLMKPCRWLASGCAMFVYGADGKLIDKTRDEGDDGRFQQKWGKAWRRSLSEKTVRWLRETRLPEFELSESSSMADFAAYMERASKDFVRPDMPKDKSGIRFRCCESAARFIFSDKPNSERSPTAVFACSDMSFWDVLTNVCETAGCAYRFYDREVYLCNCK